MARVILRPRHVPYAVFFPLFPQPNTVQNSTGLGFPLPPNLPCGKNLKSLFMLKYKLPLPKISQPILLLV